MGEGEEKTINICISKDSTMVFRLYFFCMKFIINLNNRTGCDLPFVNINIKISYIFKCMHALR